MASLPRPVPPLALVLALAGCAGRPDGPPQSHTTIRDTSGIQLVESTAPVGPDAVPWTVDSAPVVDIGARQDDPHQEFSGNLSALRLRSGEIVVAVSGANELRFFDSTGAWVRSVGRRGQGPGEFQSLGWLAPGPGDTLRAYDWNLHRLSVFAATGEFVRSFMLASPGAARAAIPVAVLADGGLLVSGSPFVMPGHASGVARDTAPLLRYSRTGAVSDSFGRFPGSEALILGTEKSVMVMSCPFGKDLAVAVVPGRDIIYAGSEDDPEVGVWTADGRLIRLIRWQARKAAVTEADRAAYLEDMTARERVGQEEMQRRFRRMVEQATLPAHKPAYAGLVAGPRGTLWVQGYTAPDRETPVPYQVFDSAGGWLGAVHLPPRFSAAQVGEDFVLGLWKDPDDVDHVRLYRLSLRDRS